MTGHDDRVAGAVRELHDFLQVDAIDVDGLKTLRVSASTGGPAISACRSALRGPNRKSREMSVIKSCLFGRTCCGAWTRPKPTS